MLLGAVKGELVAWELLVDLAGDVGPGTLIAHHPGDHDVPERRVGLAIPSAVKTVSLVFAAAGIDRGHAAEMSESGFAA